MPLKPFNYTLDFANINFREQPQLYRIGKVEQGVLLVEPYKSEILPHWRFKTSDVALASAQHIYQQFLDYKAGNDFIGMDMARKFLQMGYTRSRRYANHKSGKKYDGPVPNDKKGKVALTGASNYHKLWMRLKQPRHECFMSFGKKQKTMLITRKWPKSIV